MHDFLRAVGFKNIKDQKELDELLQSIVSSPTNYMSARDSEGNEYAEFTRICGFHGNYSSWRIY